MSLKDRLNLNEKIEINTENEKEEITPYNIYDNFLTNLLNQNKNIIVSCPIDIPTYSGINFLCSKISNDKRLVGIGTNLLLHPSEIIKFEPDTKNNSKELIKTAMSLNPDKIILQDFDGAEAVDVFKLINSGIKNIISAVNAENVKNAMRQIELNLYLNGVCMPETMMKSLLSDFVNIVIVLKKSNINSYENAIEISKIYELSDFKNNEYKFFEVTPRKEISTENVKEKNEQDKNKTVLSDVKNTLSQKKEEPIKKKNILASRIKKKTGN